jgi:hypothetical protein
MNTQEALEAMLDERRKWVDTPEVSASVALEALKDLADVASLENLTPDALGMMGGAVLYLMVDEVTVVQPERTLDEWLVGDVVPDPGNRRGMAFDRAEHGA